MSVAAQRHDFPDDDIAQVASQLRELLAARQFLTLGWFGEAFEQAFAERHHAPFAAATSSGTAALEAILRAVDVGGGEVVVPTNTFAATAFAADRAGARPVFADIGPDLTLDPTDAIGASWRLTGSRVVDHLARRGADVTNLDRR